MSTEDGSQNGAAGNGPGESGEGGCACNAGGTNGGSLFGLALMAMFVRLRRRRSRCGAPSP